MSKIEAGQFTIDREQIDLHPLITETVRVISLQAAEKQITVETKIAPDLTFYADRRTIKQIIINLLSNAVKFTGQGGHILVRARHVSGAMMLSIEDNGCGIPKEALSKLDGPSSRCRTSSRRTTRLGARPRDLALARRTAWRRLKIRSTENVGTSVSVRTHVRKTTPLAKAA